MTPAHSNDAPLISVIILNYNGAPWLERCLSSLKDQTIFEQLEIIVADNASPDKSDVLAEQLMRDWPNGRVVQHGANLGFCEGNNRATLQAKGKYFFFLNNDTWMEPNCMELLVAGLREKRAQAATPLMLNYDDNTVQSSGGAGFDVFGLMSLESPHDRAKEIFVVGGCSFFIEAELFRKLNGFDSVFFMYADEYDLSWRVWASGGSAVSIPQARLHHRGAASVNPKGGGRVVEIRTSDTKRFYTNRNCLMLLLKNCQHILLFTVPLQLLLLTAEACVGLILFRRWSFVKRAYLDAVCDCWRLRNHIQAERKRMKALRGRSDFQMLRFLRMRLNRWDELQNMRRHGMPKVAPK